MDNTVSFYDALAPMFDVMTDWDARLAAEGPFLRTILEEAGAKTVLDAACGSGGHALWLARQGYRAAGADVSPGMIALARQKAVGAGVDVPFEVSDLGNLTAWLPSLASDLPPQPPSLRGRGEVRRPSPRRGGVGGEVRRRPLPGQLTAAPADPG